MDFMDSLNSINEQLQKQRDLQNSVARHSKVYMKSITREIKLLDQKKELLKRQSYVEINN